MSEKLSSHVVEVTILLSNLYKTKINTRSIHEKIIEIQPVNQIKERYNDEHQISDEEVSVEDQVKDLQKELERLEKKRVNLIKKTNQEIDDQKEQWMTEKQTYIENAEKVVMKRVLRKGKRKV